MARLTGSCTGGWGSRYSYYLDYTLNSQNVSNNTSNITLTAWAQASASNYQAYNNSTTANTYKIYIDGTNKVSSTKSMDFRNRAVVSLGSWTGNVSHGSDGKKTINIGGKFTISGTSSLSGGTVSGNWVLPTIARASTPTLSTSSQDVGSSLIVYTNRASTSFTHSIEVYFGSWNATVATGVTDNYTWTLPTALANQIPSSSSGWGTIRLVTYNGTTHIGNKDISFTVTVPNNATYNPTATGLSAWINGSGRDKTIGKYIQGVSRVSTSFTPATKGGASVSSQTITVNGVAYNGKSITSNVIGSSGTITISAKVVDSRGRSASTSTTISVDAYAKPSISSFSAVRVVNTSNVNITRNGSFSYLGGSNPLTLTIEQQTVGISTWTSVESTNGGTTGSFSGSKTVTGLSDSSSYNFRITIADTFGNKATSSSSVGTSIVPMSWSKTGVGAGKIWEQGALDVGGEAFLDGMSLNKTNILPSGDGSLAYWHTLKAGTYFANPSTVTGQPTDYGILVFYRNTLSGACDFSAIWHTQATGSIYRLSGNSSNMYSWVEMSSAGHTHSTNDSGWINLPLMNGAQAVASGLQPRYRKIGNIVHVQGEMQGLTVASDSAVQFGTLPSGYRPTNANIHTICQGSGNNLWLLVINSDGTCMCGRYRYGSLQSGAISVGTWLPLSVMFIL